ncbi:hypothetical protein U5U50_02795 [Mycoplasma sp. 888]|uniref:hypothetical protein n=1 Tax=Mycoplasma sp. 888 TaxID=3108483 RepID=UPI002D774ED1|nr:hypothetical protein [Mycoplasma sp. 888]WRQ25708.1 hypothetical protein U5U50_02795 [Mycoplasma sp. 888]
MKKLSKYIVMDLGNTFIKIVNYEVDLRTNEIKQSKVKIINYSVFNEELAKILKDLEDTRILVAATNTDKDLCKTIIFAMTSKLNFMSNDLVYLNDEKKIIIKKMSHLIDKNIKHKGSIGFDILSALLINSIKYKKDSINLLGTYWVNLKMENLILKSVSIARIVNFSDIPFVAPSIIENELKVPKIKEGTTTKTATLNGFSALLSGYVSSFDKPENSIISGGWSRYFDKSLFNIEKFIVTEGYLHMYLQFLQELED